jgi:phosphatidylglycerophosphate synthase
MTSSRPDPRAGRFVTHPDNFLQVPVRWLSAKVSRALLPTPITPNQVTITRGLLNGGALLAFAEGSPGFLVLGFALFQVFEVLDHVDGDLARLRRRSSRFGMLMEAFIDTYGARPSNLFGLCIAIGMMRQTGALTGPALFVVIAVGRLLWLEYRGPFGWGDQRAEVLGGEHGEYKPVFGTGSARKSLRNLAVITYTWQNQLMLWAALLQSPVQRALGLDALTWSLVVVAVLNHMPWITLVSQGFRRAWGEGTRVRRP